MKINELHQSETKTSKNLDASLNFERSPHPHKAFLLKSHLVGPICSYKAHNSSVTLILEEQVLGTKY